MAAKRTVSPITR
jgi:hypothetical protein